MANRASILVWLALAVLLGASGGYVLSPSTGLTTYGVLIGAGAGPVAVTAAGNTGEVLTATSGANPSFQVLPIKSYSEMYLTNETGVNLTVTTGGLANFQELPASTLTVGLQDVDGRAVGNVAGNKITIGTGGAGIYVFQAQISWEGTNGKLQHWSAAINGVEQSKLRVGRHLNGGGQIISATSSGLLSLADGQYVTLVFESEATNDTMIVYHIDFTLRRWNI